MSSVYRAKPKPGGLRHAKHELHVVPSSTHVQYRASPTEMPMMMPTTPGMGMELAGVPALTPARKTTASMPSRMVVVKASRKMPVMASLEVACTAPQMLNWIDWGYLLIVLYQQAEGLKREV